MDETFLALQRALAGEYSLEREIGRGGMGIVYLAREVQLDRLVAIKVLPDAFMAREDVRQRFIREARTAAGLSHPNIVPIHRVGDAEGRPYFVMTYVRGTTLGERLRSRGPLAPTALSRVVHDVALALGYAHGRGIIHRDVKPDNILIEEDSGRALVTDFGIAHVRTSDDASERGVMGTLEFMSPEQSRGEPIDGRSDIYSLGVVAFMTATGRFPTSTISSAEAGIPGAIGRVIDRCLEFEPTDRYSSAEEVATALDASTAPARAAIPAVIRDWTSQPAPLLNIYGFWSAGWFIAAIEQYVRWVDPRAWPLRPSAFPNMVIGLGMAALPLVPITVFQLRKTHRVLKAGYGLGDLRAALQTWKMARREELANADESDWAQMLRAFTWFCAVAVPAAMITIDTRPYYHVPNSVRLAVMGTILAGVGSLVILGALGVPLFSPKLERFFAGRLRERLWGSRLGAWLAKKLTPAQRGVPETDFRPTELALKLAVEDLYAALPEPYRVMLGDLPAVASRLSAHVSELRGEVDRLELVRSQVPRGEESRVEGMLRDSRRELGQVVGALERMRLELLRLHGGASDLQPLTTSLDAARAMVDDIVRLQEAEGEANLPRRVLPVDVRSPSPA